MTEYAILLPGDESAWADATPEQQAEMFQRHMKFTELLEARGHQVTGGNELQPSTATHTVTGSLEGSGTRWASANFARWTLSDVRGRLLPVATPSR